jgi:hypothetical protein
MKKEYISPAFTIEGVGLQQIICNSIVNVEDGGTGIVLSEEEDPGNVSADSRWNDIWNEVDEDEF